MSTPLTAQPTLYKTPGSVLPIAASFVAELTAGDTLTGTPTATVSPAGPILSAPAINTQPKQIEIEGNQHWAQAGQAVTLLMSGGSVNDDGSARTYTVYVTVGTLGGGLFDKRPITVVVSNS
jgi:hypothetical protein